MGEANHRIILRMKERLFAGLLNGPNLNCRPHASRQRVDWLQFAKLQDVDPVEGLLSLLDKRKVQFTARVEFPEHMRKLSGRRFGRSTKATQDPVPTAPVIAPMPAEAVGGGDSETTANATSAGNGDPGQPAPPPSETPSENGEVSAEKSEKVPDDPWTQQQTLVKKLRVVADDARTYEQDTGVHVLQVGFPLLSLPAAASGKSGTGAKRVLAPIAFIPVNVTLRATATSVIDIACQSDGIDTIMPNMALLAWLEQQTNSAPEDLYADEEGGQPWREIAEIVSRVAALAKVEVPELFRKLLATEKKSPHPKAEEIGLRAAPRAEDDDATRPAILMTAILGLFPMNNQGLLRDTLAMAQGDALEGPVQSFLDVHVTFDKVDETAPDKDADDAEAAPNFNEPRKLARGDRRLVSASDPCQMRAVRLAREARGLVVHGPPGTGKSQTITNIIGDHLARGERVLMVCDKRTALDVVANRLEHLGLGSLCAVVHDPQFDQRDLYRAVREQIESLAEVTTTDTSKQLGRADRELKKIHQELTQVRQLVMEPDKHGTTFHALAGRWLNLQTKCEAAGIPDFVPLEGAEEDVEADTTQDADALGEWDQHTHAVQHLLERMEQVEYPQRPWREIAAVTVADFLAQPLEKWRAKLKPVVAASKTLDGTFDSNIPPFLPDAKFSLTAQTTARKKMLELWDRLLAGMPPEDRARWGRELAQISVTAMQSRLRTLVDIKFMWERASANRLDPELLRCFGDRLPSVRDMTPQIATLELYLQSAGKWYGFLMFQRKREAAAVLKPFGLVPSVESAKRCRAFLVGVALRDTLQNLLGSFNAPSSTTANNVSPGRKRAATTPKAPTSVDGPPRTLTSDELLQKSVESLSDLFGLIELVEKEPLLTSLAGPIVVALQDEAQAEVLADGLRKSEARATAIDALATLLPTTGLFGQRWIAGQRMTWCINDTRAEPLFAALLADLPKLEGVLRIHEQLEALPTSLQSVIDLAVEIASDEFDEVDPEGPAFQAETVALQLERDLCATALTRRIDAEPALRGLDPDRLQSWFERHYSLSLEHQQLVRDNILHRWVTRQKERLLVSTGSRLNSAGADLKRRLTTRGERAMRLRQVIAVGQEHRQNLESTDGAAGAAETLATLPGQASDPLFDLRPLWMASPETVAQIFPRLPLFDIVIFDEASQCRLEEALPVLTRARRVMIAGDPQQLPPSRFFESAVAASGDDGSTLTEQSLFESHQGETEDLLTAALGLDIQQCYLDVHYRSRNSALIEFSNTQFYNRRLQALPGHPDLGERETPITLHQVNGLYQDRTNAKEAEKICEIVAELLASEAPPSIGIACFNLTQRDLIVDKLDERAASDESFAAKLAEARVRWGNGSFEGLFVKNLENVQGDERDQILISTTYGPDAKGKFYRRFGPLGQAGGGRRLNVLVTRARVRIHLVTSIPPDIYRALPPIPLGQAPGGGWLLFAYLSYARQLQQEAETEAKAASSAADNPGDVEVWPTRYPSPFAEALGRKLAREQEADCTVHWGNDGFCVDVAVERDGETTGILCDGTRFAQSDDPVEWDIFRSAILTQLGWKLTRLWSPQFFRNPEGTLDRLPQ